MRELVQILSLLVLAAPTQRSIVVETAPESREAEAGNCQRTPEIDSHLLEIHPESFGSVDCRRHEVNE
jgi:hypothetical protein